MPVLACFGPNYFFTQLADSLSMMVSRSAVAKNDYSGAETLAPTQDVVRGSAPLTSAPLAHSLGVLRRLSLFYACFGPDYFFTQLAVSP
jgi:hypothetical protein